MPKRRRLHGKKLLVVSASIGAASVLGCGGDDSSVDSGPVANLLLPMDASHTDAAPEAGPSDSGFIDAPVANLLPPMDSSFMDDAAADDGDAGD